LPTLAGLGGAGLPADRVIDGKNIWPLMSAQPGAKTPHEAFFYYWAKHLQAVRSGKWKLHLPHNYPHPEPPGADAKPGKHVTQEIGLALFDLDNDVGETTNVAGQHPDVVKRLEELAAECREDLGDSQTKREGKNVRPPGMIADSGQEAK
jgi:arylsulfatase A